MAPPQVTTSIGTFRPTALYSYDQFNNVTVYSDPIQTNKYGGDWVGSNPGHPYSTGDNLCGAIAGSAIYTYNYSDASEPYGYLTDTYTPLGYHTAIVYSTSAEGGDYGLPTSVTGTSFTQNNGTNAQPQQSFTYDAYGNLQTYSKGYGSYQLSYDLMHRMTSVTDPDSVTSRTYYNPDSTVECKQTAYQYSLDGAACGTYSEDYTYDPDANELSETHHHGQTPTNGVATGITQKWYDGEDRLIEVSLPSDDYADKSVPGRTRYIYDLTEDVNVTFSGTNQSPSYPAHGNVYKTQNYSPATPGDALSWNDVNGNAFDSLNRSVDRYQYTPGTATGGIRGSWAGTLEAWSSTYDATPYVGLLTSKTDPIGTITSYTYDALNRPLSIGFNDGVTAGRTYVYDPDGRAASISSTAFTTPDTYQYDADGRETQYVEASGGGTTAPATVAYSYYPSGWRSALTVSASPAISQSNVLSYNYRNDGARTSLAIAGQSQPFVWTYTNSGRPLTQSDPLTGLAPTNNPTAPFVAKTYSYDAYGRLNALTLPGPLSGSSSSGLQYQNMTYTTEGELAQFGTNASTAATSAFPTGVAYQYDVRGENAVVGGSSGKTSGAFDSLNESMFLGGALCPTSSAGTAMPANPPLVQPVCEQDTDYFTGVNGAGGPYTYSQGCSGAYQWAYDMDGREATQSVYPVSNYLCTDAEIPLTEARVYDAENHTLSSTTYAGLAATQTGQTALEWGPSGNVRTVTVSPGNSGAASTTTTLHWDGNQLLFVTDPNGNLLQVNAEKLGEEIYSVAGEISPQGKASSWTIVI